MSQAIIWRDRDADLIPSNVKAGVQIDDTLGILSPSGYLPWATTAGIVFIREADNNMYTTRITWPSYGIIDMSDAIYIIYIYGWLQWWYPWDQETCVWWIRYDKITGVITYLPMDYLSWYFNTPAVQKDSIYVDWTDIHINCSNPSSNWHHTLDTTSDTRTNGWWIVTTWALNTAANVVFWWLTITPTTQPNYAPWWSITWYWFIWYLTLT